MNVGHASDSEEANHVSALLAKVRAAISAFKPVNADGPVPIKRVKELLEGSLPMNSKGLDLLDTHRDAKQNSKFSTNKSTSCDALSP